MRYVPRASTFVSVPCLQYLRHSVDSMTQLTVMEDFPQPFDSVGLQSILSQKEEKPVIKHDFNILEDELPTEDQPFRELFTKIISKGLLSDSAEIRRHDDAPTVSIQSG